MPTLTSKLVRGRKEHRCDLCGLRIRRGARHVVRTGFDDGKPWRFRAHEICDSKTRDWTTDDWELCFDAVDFRFYDLDLPLLKARRTWRASKDTNGADVKGHVLIASRK